MSGATRFHLIRHASYELLGRVLAGRSGGHSLGPAGRAEAEALASVLGERPVAAVVSSPLERARETAAPIAARHRLAVGIDPDLDEIDFGEWTGLAFDVLHADPAWRRFNVFRSTTPIPGGESMLAAQARGLAAVLRLRAAHPGAEVVAVSHGDIIKAVLAHFLATPLDLMRRIEISPASRSVLVLDAADARIEAVNLTLPRRQPG
jgi:broad specificity phosphatase PhoE